MAAVFRRLRVAFFCLVLCSHSPYISDSSTALVFFGGVPGIYIKSGEGNGGDTWWDSGVIQKVQPTYIWQSVNGGVLR